MTGSTLAAIVIPIVAMFGLAARIVVVFHADSHPLWENRTTAAPNRALARPSRKVRAFPAPAAGSVRPASQRLTLYAHGGQVDAGMSNQAWLTASA